MVCIQVFSYLLLLQKHTTKLHMSPAPCFPMIPRTHQLPSVTASPNSFPSNPCRAPAELLYSNLPLSLAKVRKLNDG